MKGEQPYSRSINYSRVAFIVMACLIASLLVLSQRDNIEEYRLYFTETRKPAKFQFSELSEDWTEKTLRERFYGYPMSCQPYQGDLPVDRACGVDVNSHNGVPALFISFFFSAGHLDQAVVNVPWWSHDEAFDTLVATLGQPDASQLLPHKGVRLYGWHLPRGAALFLNRDRPLNLFSWNAIYWSSPSACAQRGCFKNKKS